MVRSGAYDRKGSSSQSMANGSCDVRSAKRRSETNRTSACDLCGAEAGVKGGGGVRARLGSGVGSKGGSAAHGSAES